MTMQFTNQASVVRPENVSMLESFTRSRKIKDRLGKMHLVLTLKREGPSSLATITRKSDYEAERPIMLSTHGMELLAAYLMAARYSGSTALPPEQASDCSGLQMALVRNVPVAEVVVSLKDGDQMLALPETVWEQLSTELLITSSHIRALDHP